MNNNNPSLMLLKSRLEREWSSRREMEGALIERDRLTIETVRDFVSESIALVEANTHEEFTNQTAPVVFSQDGKLTGFGSNIVEFTVKNTKFEDLSLMFVVSDGSVWFRGNRYEKKNLSSLLDAVAGIIYDRYSVVVQAKKWFDDNYEIY